ncbi:MAG: DUF4143 domain-containing protein, partial [Candidatus Hodarchaeales archaeon]
DTHSLQNFLVVATASHTLDIAAGAERLIGRQGVDDPLPNKILLPMKFVEYVEIRNPKLKIWIQENRLKDFTRRKKILLSLFTGDKDSILTELELFLNDLNTLLIDYTISGGVVKAIDSYLSQMSISNQLYNEFKEYLLGEILKARKREDFLIQVLSQLIDTHTSPVGWETLKKKTHIGSSETISDYVNFIQNCYLLSVVHILRLDKGRPDYKRRHKIYFTDPFIFHSLRSWVNGEENPLSSSLAYIRDVEKLSLLMEDIVASHLLRWIYNYYQSPLIEPNKLLFFWRNKKDKEVDFILKLDNHYYPIEVKYRNKIKDINGLLRFREMTSVERGLVLSKNIVDFSDSRYNIFPISLFLLLI